MYDLFAKNRPEVLVEARGRMGKGLGDGLLQADHADDQGDAAYLVAAKLEGLVGGVVGNDEDGIVRGAAADALDERALVGVEDIDLVPLEKKVGGWHSLAGYDVAGGVLGVHGRAFDRDEEIGPLECRNDISLALVLQHRDVAGERPGHGGDGQKRDTLVAHRRRGGKRNIARLWDVRGGHGAFTTY